MVDKPADKSVDKIVDKTLSVADRILLEIRNNPNITQPKLAEVLMVGKTTVQNGIFALKKRGLIVRVGSNKNGYWKVLE